VIIVIEKHGIKVIKDLPDSRHRSLAENVTLVLHAIVQGGGGGVFSIFFHFTHFRGNINSFLELQGDIFLSFDDDAMPLNILPLPMPCYGRLYTTCFITTAFSPHQIDTKFAFLEKCLLVQLHYGLYLILMGVFDINSVLLVQPFCGEKRVKSRKYYTFHESSNAYGPWLSSYKEIIPCKFIFLVCQICAKFKNDPLCTGGCTFLGRTKKA